MRESNLTLATEKPLVPRSIPPLRHRRLDPPVSVIVPAHNEANYLPKTLEALRKQTYPNLEVIVVANGCTDGTEAVAKGRCHKLFSLSEKGLSRARNIGAKKARGSLLVFLDADTILEPCAIETIAKEFTRTHAMGTLKGKPDSSRRVYRLIYFWKNLMHRTRIHYGSSGVILCWKDHFQAVGGFDENLHLRENSDLMYKLRRFGSYNYLGSITATTSMRRYEKRGTRRTVLMWLKVWFVSLFSDIRKKPYESVR